MIKKIVIIVSIILFIIYAVLLIPREFNRSYDGVKYRLGDNKGEIIENVTIEFKGTIFRTLTLKEKFKGTVRINDFIIPSEKNKEDYVVFDFGYKDWIIIQEFYYDEKTNCIKRTLFGDLFMSKDRDKLTINIIENDSWSGQNGLMISAPAKNRKEALAISNEVMRTFFDGWFSKFE